MAEKTKNNEVTDEKATVIQNKTPDKTNVAPGKVKPTEGSTEPIDAEDIDYALMLLNIIDEEAGGKGEIAGIPDEMTASLKFLIEKLVFVREMFEDPMWKALMDDLSDQKEDGKTPSVEVAIARSIPMEKLQELADSEDYEGVQGELSEGLAMQAQTADEDAQYEANFLESQKAGEEYAAEMGYDETRKNALFQKVMDLLKIMGDGILTKAEFADVDKMLNYDTDTESLRAQLSSQDVKEVLPDQASVDATLSAKNNKTTPSVPTTGPGMGSISAYDDVNTNITDVGKRKRVR